MLSDSKIRQPKFPLRQSTFTFYEHDLEEKWFFLWNSFFFSLRVSMQKFLIIYSGTMTACTKYIRDLFVNATCIFVISKKKLLWYNDWVYQSPTKILASRHGEREKIIREENACTKHIRDLFVNDTCIFVISKNEFLLSYNDWVYQSSTKGNWMNLLELYTVHL